jgi:poly(3-hydroxybutyrate) depolymerase
MRSVGRVLAAGLLSGCALAGPGLQAAPIAPGKSEQTIRLGEQTMSVFTYRPDCANPSLLLVFHGQNRDAQTYRNAAVPIADRLCTIVVAPLFDKEHFPGWRYQRGGIVRKDAVRDPRRFTGNIVDELAAWVRREERRALAYSLIGHSAGGQFLSRCRFRADRGHAHRHCQSVNLRGPEPGR